MPNKEQRILYAVLLNVSLTILEVLGGFWTNSLAILSDAIHDFGDSVALGSSWILERKARKIPDKVRTYGYQRLSLFSALFSALVLVAGSLIIFFQAIPRLFNPQLVDAFGMLGLAIIGIILNGLGVVLLKKGQSLNEKVLSWHLLEDVLGWLIILIGSIAIYFWDIYIIDPIMTMGLTGFILYNVLKNLKETTNILLQGVPRHISLVKIEKNLLDIKGVLGVHDLHVWSLEGETDVFTGHVIIEDTFYGNPDQVRNKIKNVLLKHHIEHSTIELERKGFCSGFECNDWNDKRLENSK
jgi:cobalt-zinc-cadmium efflux system protein